MATYYWTGLVGSGTGTWDNSLSLNWSLSSGGAGGAGPPTSADIVIFDASSGAGTVTIGAGAAALTLTMTGYTGTVAYGTNSIALSGNAATIFTGATTYSVTGTPLIVCSYAGATGTRTIAPTGTTEANAISFNFTAGTDTVVITGASAIKSVDFTGFSGTYSAANNTTVYGNFKLSATLSISGSGNTLTFGATLGTQLITSNGKTMDRFVNASGAGSKQLQDNFAITATRTFTLTSGTLDLNGKTLTTGNFTASGVTARTIAFGAGGGFVIIDSGAAAFTAATSTNLTITGTGTISMTSASAKTFSGGGKTWPALSQDGAGALTITGANTFSDITNTVNGTAVNLPASTTTTVAALSLHGASGSVTTLQSSSSGTPATLSKSGGDLSVSYLNIKDITATGGAIWRAPSNLGNADGGGNGGWLFGMAGGGAGGGLSQGLGLGL